MPIARMTENHCKINVFALLLFARNGPGLKFWHKGCANCDKNSLRFRQ